MTPQQQPSCLHTTSSVNYIQPISMEPEFDSHPVRKLASNVASRLDQENVPNLAFGYLALNLTDSSRESFKEVDFVIPDAQMSCAIATLIMAGYNHCEDATCNEANEDRKSSLHPSSEPIKETQFLTYQDRFHPAPFAHFHLDSADYILSLHLQSALLWWLPEIQTGPPDTADPDIILWDNEETTGVSFLEDKVSLYSSGYHPIRTLNSSSLTEAFIMLYCRDVIPEKPVRIHWLLFVAKLLDHWDAPGVNRRKFLRDEFKLVWECLNKRNCQNRLHFLEPLWELATILAQEGMLGPLVDGES